MSSANADERTALIVSPWAAAAAAAAVTLLTALADLLTPAEVVVPIVYGVPLLLCVWVRDLRFLWALAAVLISLNLATAALGSPALAVPEAQAVFINRALATVAVLVIAGLVHLGVVALRVVERQRESLEKHNADLEAANQELTDREEEIVRQNEELQSQSEELERQSEELRITNEELATREKMLEQLLELSRSLTADLDRGETLKRICEALGVLVDAPASGILERRGERLHLSCDHGFGPDGPESRDLPYAQSFAALVLSRGQTGYVEDLTLRPDLVVPRPRGEAPFRSVLSAPLRVHGRGIGAIEIYHPQKRSWSDAQVQMIESLAAQASISLAGAELI